LLLSANATGSFVLPAQTHIIPTAVDIDPDVLSNMTSLGCFKDKEKLIKEMLATRYELVRNQPIKR
jgi:hypothetical protein